MIAMELPPPTPTEQTARVKSFFSKAPREIQPQTAEINAAITFFNQVRSGIHKGSIQQRGRGSKAVPGPRDLTFFVLAGKTDGWMGALEQMRVFCMPLYPVYRFSAWNCSVTQIETATFAMAHIHPEPSALWS